MLTGVNVITTDNYIQMLHHTIKNGKNLLALGMPGIGKTAIPYQIAKALGYDVVYLNLSVMQPPDLMGLPSIDEKTFRVRYASPEFMPVFDQTPRPVIMLCDELDKADSEMQNPMLEFFDKRTICGTKMNVQAIIATGNMPDDQSHGKPISHALSNRCMVFAVEANFEKWRDWAVQNGVHGLITGFLSRHSDYFIKKSKANDPTEYSKCSPRSWTNASDSLTLADPNASVDYLSLLISGYVGQEAAVKFRVWLEHYAELGPAIDHLMETGQANEEQVDKVFVLGLSAMNKIVSSHNAWKTETDAQKKAELGKSIRKWTLNSFSWLTRIPPNFQYGIVKAAFLPAVASEHKLANEKPLMEVYNKIHEVLSKKI